MNMDETDRIQPDTERMAGKACIPPGFFGILSMERNGGR